MPVRRKQSLWKNTTKITILLPIIKHDELVEHKYAHSHEYNDKMCLLFVLKSEMECVVGGRMKLIMFYKKVTLFLFSCFIYCVLILKASLI